jgi:hypothetical protein
MFNLEQSIVEWRRQTLAVGINPPVMEELESHLREEIEVHIQSGMGEERAFALAVRQIGPGKVLKTEFKKNRRLMSILEIELVKKEWEFKWGPILHFALFTGALGLFGGMVLFKWGAYSEATSCERLSSLAATVVSYLLLNIGLLGYKLFPVIPANRTRQAICICCAVVVSLWAMIFLARVNVNMQQFVTDFAWAFFVPFGALLGLILGLERAAQKKIKIASS